MTSIFELRNQMPKPEKCAICGKKISEVDAELDHIVPQKLGGTDAIDNLRWVCQQCNRLKSDRYSRLQEYYIRLMQSKGMYSKASGAKISHILQDMSSRDLEHLEERVSLEDRQYRRINAYYDALSKLQAKGNMVAEEQAIYNKDFPITPESDVLANEMQSTVKAYDNYDIDSENRIMINGNTFVYESDFPIEAYREDLAAYGEDEQGETYSVYLDNEGRLVVY